MFASSALNTIVRPHGNPTLFVSAGPIFQLQPRYLPEILHIAAYQNCPMSQGDTGNQEITATDILQFLILSESIEFLSRSCVHGDDFQRPEELIASLQ